MKSFYFTFTEVKHHYKVYHQNFISETLLHLRTTLYSYVIKVTNFVEVSPVLARKFPNSNLYHRVSISLLDMHRNWNSISNRFFLCLRHYKQYVE